MAWAEPVPTGSARHGWMKRGQPLLAVFFIAALATGLGAVVIPSPRPADVDTPTAPVSGRYIGLQGIQGRGFVPDGWNHFSDAGIGHGHFLFPFVVATDPIAFEAMVERSPDGSTMSPLDPQSLRGDDAYVEMIAVFPPPGLDRPRMARFPERLEIASLKKAGPFRGEPVRFLNARLPNYGTGHLVVWMGPFATDGTRREVNRIVEGLQVGWRP